MDKYFSNLKFANLVTPDTLYNDLTLYHCGKMQCAPSHMRCGVRDHYIIHYVLSGKGKFKVKDKVHTLGKGEGFLICPGILSAYEADQEDPWQYCWFAFHGLKADAFLQQAGLDADNPLFYFDTDSSLIECIQNLVAANSLCPHDKLKLTGLLYLVFSKLCSISSANKRSGIETGKKAVYINKAVDFIKRNYSDKITINEIANYLGINRKYFHSLFKEHFNMSPQTFLIEYRINKACELLGSSSLSIMDVAHSTGYEDPLLFSRIFKKHKGLSPTEYRRTQLKG